MLFWWTRLTFISLFKNNRLLIAHVVKVLRDDLMVIFVWGAALGNKTVSLRSAYIFLLCMSIWHVDYYLPLVEERIKCSHHAMMRIWKFFHAVLAASAEHWGSVFAGSGYLKFPLPLKQFLLFFLIVTSNIYRISMFHPANGLSCPWCNGFMSHTIWKCILVFEYMFMAERSGTGEEVGVHHVRDSACEGTITLIVNTTVVLTGSSRWPGFLFSRPSMHVFSLWLNWCSQGHHIRLIPAATEQVFAMASLPFKWSLVVYNWVGLLVLKTSLYLVWRYSLVSVHSVVVLNL